MKGGLVMTLKKPINGSISLLLKAIVVTTTVVGIILAAGRVLNQASVNTQDIAGIKTKIPDIERRVTIMETLMPEIKDQSNRIENKVDLLLMKNQIVYKR